MDTAFSRRVVILVTILSFLVISVGGCSIAGQPEATPTTPSASPSSVPSTKSPTPTATRDTPTPTPTSTREPPTSTPTATGAPGTATPTATLTRLPPTPTRTRTPTATPRLPTPTRTRTPVCSVPYATRLHTSSQAIVRNDTSHWVRSAATTSANILGHISTGEIVDLLDGPVCGNNMWWWLIHSTSSGLEGWSAEASGGVFWLQPYSGGPTCTSTSQRVTFPSGGTSYKVKTTLSTGCTKSYILRILAGQTLILSITGYPNPGLEEVTVRNPNGSKMTGDGAAGSIYYHASTTGDYTITASGSGPIEFDIVVPPH